LPPTWRSLGFLEAAKGNLWDRAAKKLPEEEEWFVLGVSYLEEKLVTIYAAP
jgi:hypothetical protein